MLRIDLLIIYHFNYKSFYSFLNRKHVFSYFNDSAFVFYKNMVHLYRRFYDDGRESSIFQHQSDWAIHRYNHTKPQKGKIKA